MIKVTLEALDHKSITPRTGKSKVNAETNHLPIEGRNQIFFYVNETCESPGISIYTQGIERLGNEIKFYDNDRRPFKMTIL